MISPDISKEELDKFKHLLDYFKRLSEDGVTPLIEKQLLAMLDFSLPFFSNLVMRDRFPEIHRLTVNRRVVGSNKRIRDISQLKYPPVDKVNRYGRCNLPSQSVLYASFGSMITLSEVKPRIGDLITKTIWRAKDDATLIYSPIFKNQPTHADTINLRTYEINQIYEEKVREYSVNAKAQLDALLQFVTDAFTKSIHPEANLDYVFSAYFSNKIFNEFEKGKIEAIYYPSVQSKLSFENIAIKPDVFDSKYELAEVKESLVVVDPSTGRGGYFMEATSDCKSFDFASGKVLWNGSILRMPKARFELRKNEFDLDID